MPTSVGPPRIVSVADLRRAAKKRLPRAVFDYIDGGADAEVTLRENCRAFNDVIFRPRCAVATKRCDLNTTVLGATNRVPFLLAPVGSSRLFYPRGEEVAARAAGEAGTTYILSTLSGCPVQDVKRASSGPVWYQLYLIGGRDVALGAIARARDAGCTALVVTIDTPVRAKRPQDWRNGLNVPFKPNLRTIIDIATSPFWALEVLRNGTPCPANFRAYAGPSASSAEVSACSSRELRGGFTCPGDSDGKLPSRRSSR